MAPVYCEDFIQWVIEGRLPGRQAGVGTRGVEFTDDVSKYESMSGLSTPRIRCCLSPGFAGGNTAKWTKR